MSLISDLHKLNCSIFEFATEPEMVKYIAHLTPSEMKHAERLIHAMIAQLEALGAEVLEVLDCANRAK